MEAPFPHIPGALTTFDPVVRVLFSGDIWAALDLDWQLVVSDFEAHTEKMDLFHLDYMACNRAARGFIHRLQDIDAILLQHSSIISIHDVPAALAYIENLECGVDLINAELGG